MRGSLELFVEGQKVDLFDFVDMSITDKIKDVRDISKVFTSFSKEFLIPASSRNNKIFKHFYNIDINNGFDPRVKVDAEIKISGFTYKEGKLKLTKCSLKDEIPFSYSVVFHGKTIELKQLLSDLELSDLTDTLLDDFTDTYSNDFVKDGIVSGYSYNETTGVVTVGGDDLLFPFISGESFYFYDSNPLGLSPTDIVDSRNVCPTANPAQGNKGVYYADLKPSIKVKWIIKAIEQKFGIQFSEEFFRDSNKVYNDLHLWLSREKGNIFSQIEVSSQSFGLTDSLFSYDSGTDWRGILFPVSPFLPQPDPITQEELAFNLTNKSALSPFRGEGHKIKFTMNTTGTGSWTVSVKDKNQSGEPIIDSYVSNDNSVEVELNILPQNIDSIEKGHYALKPHIEISTQGGITDYYITDFKICRGVVQESFADGSYSVGEQSGCGDYSYNGDGSSSLSNGLNLVTQFPKIKIIDFLSSIFKTYNLTAEYVSERSSSEYAGQIRVLTLDNYFLQGQAYDLTKRVDTSKKEVSRNNLFSEINFDWDASSTFAVVNANQYRPKYDEFGAERISNVYEGFIDSPLAFDGGKYDVKPKFEKMMYERMSDQDEESVITTVGWGWSATENEQPKITKPIIYYPISQTTTGSIDNNGDYIEIQIDLSIYDKDGNNTAPEYETITQYYRPSNALSDYSATVNFSDEYDEWGVFDNEGGQDNSLFALFYKRYLLSIYDKQSRLIKLKAWLDTGTLMSLKLNDIVIISSRRFRINEIKDINLRTGLADLELMNDIAYSLNDLGSLVIAITSNSATETNYSIYDDNYSITQNLYDVYLDDVKVLSSQSYSGSFTLDKTTYPALDSSSIFIKSLLVNGEEMKSNVLTPLVEGLTTELNEPIITEDGVDNLIIENATTTLWNPSAQTYDSSAQFGFSVYQGLEAATYELKDLGDGTDWITIADELAPTITFTLDINWGVTRTVGIRAVDGGDNPVFIITQTIGTTTFDSTLAKFDNDIITWDKI